MCIEWYACSNMSISMCVDQVSSDPGRAAEVSVASHSVPAMSRAGSCVYIEFTFSEVTVTPCVATRCLFIVGWRSIL